MTYQRNEYLCYKNRNSMNKKIIIEKVLEYSDVFPDKKELDVFSVLKRYNRELLIKIVNVLGMNYGNAFMPDTTLFSEISYKRVQELKGRIELYAPHLKNNRFCYCTQRTILELLRYIFSIPVDEYLDNGKKEDLEYDIFRIILQLNENLMNFFVKKDLESLSIMTYFMRYVLNDVTDTDRKSTCQTQLLYFLKLKEFLEKEENKDLYFNLCKKIGIKSLDEYLITVFNLIQLYIKEQEKKRKGCPYLNIEDNKLLSISVCNYLALDIKETYQYNNEKVNDRDSNIDYRIFRSHPLIKDGEGKYYLYNLPLLCERLYNSLFFDIKDLYKGNLFITYNSVFVEQYLFQNIMLECIGKKTTSYFPHKENIGDSEMKDQPDFYIRERDSVFLFECKAIKLNGNLKDKSDINNLIVEIKNKLYLSSTNIDKQRTKKKKVETVGVTQLVKQMNLIEDDEFPWDKEIPDEIYYYPVLVIEDPKIIQVGLTSIINEWYQPLLKEQLADTASYPIIVMSINTLFRYKDIFRKYGFTKVFDNFLRVHMTRGGKSIDWTIDALADFNDYMKSSYQPSVSANAYINKQIGRITELYNQ